ncbi:hypothetical protein H9623_13330 [Oerskovia sp. Sa1BUA8]|uniref:Uncharacterized protein n=1 Tax=Oerskovia douganii TaxID=2762210 RepID=A0A9D5UIP7_9CELL|nr:hypothetical protein [Oerskovia douganii]MBE7701277.1 hypothetical protein [Oerskovia douganii]
MLDGVPLNIGELSGWGVVALIVVLLLLGKGGIAFRREVDAEKSRADTWQDAWKAERAAAQERAEQWSELLELARAADRVLTALDNARRGESP